tara:strand:+ start:9404 stop:10156 length:753 start_codon:yes stop_codon:yes gene_type:complete
MFNMSENRSLDLLYTYETDTDSDEEIQIAEAQIIQAEQWFESTFNILTFIIYQVCSYIVYWIIYYIQHAIGLPYYNRNVYDEFTNFQLMLIINSLIYLACNLNKRLSTNVFKILWITFILGTSFIQLLFRIKPLLPTDIQWNTGNWILFFACMLMICAGFIWCAWKECHQIKIFCGRLFIPLLLIIMAIIIKEYSKDSQFKFHSWWLGILICWIAQGEHWSCLIISAIGYAIYLQNFAQHGMNLIGISIT